jgi:4-amino-4-deoxy-L-arabinose transferase-like glycosyltransferase
MLVLGVLVLAAGLRLHQLGAEELWLDEAASYRSATREELATALFHDSTPPLYGLLLRGWVKTFGKSEFVLRLPSALAGVAFVLVIFALGREVFCFEAGLYAALFAALAPIHVHYSQEARAYSLLLLCLALAHLCLWRALRLGRRHDWAGLAFCSALAMYTHYLAVLGLAPAVAAVLLRPGTKALSPLASSLGAALLLVLPWVAIQRAAVPAGLDATGWIRPIWERTPPSLAVLRSLEVLGLGPVSADLPVRPKRWARVAFPEPLRALGLLSLGLLGLWALLPQGEPVREGRPSGGRKAAVTLWLLGPLAGLWLGSFHTPLYVVGRYDLPVFPAYCLLLGHALAKLLRLRRGKAVLALLAASGLGFPLGVALGRHSATPAERISSWSARVLDRHVRNGDVVVLTGLRGLQILAYLDRMGYAWHGGRCTSRSARREFGCRMFPLQTEAFPALPPARPVSAETARIEVEELAGNALRSPEADIWVVVPTVALQGHELKVQQQDAWLFAELLGRGYAFAPLAEAPWIFRFSRMHGASPRSSRSEAQFLRAGSDAEPVYSRSRQRLGSRLPWMHAAIPRPRRFRPRLAAGRRCGASSLVRPEPHPDLFPRPSAGGILRVLFQATLDLALLGFGQRRQFLRLSRNAVPQILGQLNALGDAQPQQVRKQTVHHDSKLAPTRGLRQRDCAKWRSSAARWMRSRPGRPCFA